ncbi:MAG: 3-hydroxyacyl-ACP dehydratase FabZ [Alphaproteobacteria bacterium]|nr:3-hydroxyacyl-ACP dehydratase FabZ [Alphaproteobacteria bacterium]
MSEQEVILNHPEILELIPHRPPFLLIDQVKDIVPNESACGVKAITSTEPHLGGHFPGHPIMPGVLIVEAMAQTAGVLISYSNREQNEGMHVYFTTIDQVKFRAPARPGDVMLLNVKLIAGKRSLYKFEGEATINGKVAVSGQFSAMVVEPGR